MRRKRPPALAFLLRMDTLRRLARVASLLALDFVGALPRDLHGAVPEGLGARRARPRDGPGRAEPDRGPRLVRVPRLRAAVRALGPVRRPRPAARASRASSPGCSRRRSSRCSSRSSTGSTSRATTSSTARCSSPSPTSACSATRYESTTGAVLQRRRLPAPRGARRDRRAHRRGRPRAHPRRRLARQHHGLRLAHRAARQRAALARLGPRHRPDRSSSNRVDEVIIADPAFPEQEAVELVDQCHQRGVTVRIAPSTMEILVHRAEFVPGQSVPLFELRPPVFEGFDYLLKRSFDLVGAIADPARPEPAAARVSRSR